MLIAEAELGERIMRALLLRRLGLIETGGGGPVLIGPAVHRTSCACRDSSPAMPARIAWSIPPPITRQRPCSSTTRRMTPICRSSSAPTERCSESTEVDLARALGMVRIDHPDRTYDVAIVGAGPAGLATAVRRLRGAVGDRARERSFGGQAGASSASRTILASRRAFPGRPSPAGPSCKRKSSGPRS